MRRPRSMLSAAVAVLATTVLAVSPGAAGDEKGDEKDAGKGAATAREPVGTAVQIGRFWGERPGPVRSLAVQATKTAATPQDAHPLFRWEGRVEEYGVLDVTDAGVVANDCGRGGVATARTVWNGKGGEPAGGWVVLTTCTGPGRVRVVQSMNVAGGSHPLVEIDDRDVPGASAYVVEGTVVPKAAIDALHSVPAAFAERRDAALKAEAAGDLASAAGAWSWIATHAADDDVRLWAIERSCMTRPYPGAAPSAAEQPTLAGYAEKEPVEVLPGANVILAWPVDYAAATPVRWRFLAEMDAALDWLAVWTGRDQVAARGKRMIVRFRTDDGGTALYVDFRLHVPRKEMKFPPDHGPCSHEGSHGFIDFPAICPTGRFAEGLTEVSRTSFWWFLGIDGAWRPFRANCLRGVREIRGKTIDKAPSYGAAAGVYLTVEEAARGHPGDVPDWSLLARLFETARDTPVAKDLPAPARFALLAEVCEKALGLKARAALTDLGLPK